MKKKSNPGLGMAIPKRVRIAGALPFPENPQQQPGNHRSHPEPSPFPLREQAPSPRHGLQPRRALVTFKQNCRNYFMTIHFISLLFVYSEIIRNFVV